MPEHRIRLRGPWDWAPLGTPGRPEGRVELPTAGLPPLPLRIRLTRRFGRPRFDPEAETLGLELERVPGLVAVGLNGSELPASVGPVVRIPIDGPIPARNTLTLDVDLGPLGAFEGDWGVVALVVGPKRGGPGIIAPGPIEGGTEGGGGG